MTTPAAARGPAAPGGSHARRQRRVDALVMLAALGFGVVVAATSLQETRGSLAAPGGISTAIGRVTGMAGTYLMLVTVLLAGRLPVLERAAGQDRLLHWHRRLGPWPLYLITAHVVFTTLGYASATATGPLAQVRQLLTGYPDVLAAAIAYGLLVAVGVSSYRKARRRLRYETWWVIHLYAYLALALSFAHQLVTGQAFVGHPLSRLGWLALWAGTAGVVLVYRVGLPVYRSLRHDLRVAVVQREADGVVSVIARGRNLDALDVAGGQFLQWRFLTRGLWWQAHPYSLSALPRRGHIRVTIKDLGDHSGGLGHLRRGTRIAVEGPYGVFTAHARHADRVLLVGAGVGITPLRALLEDLPSAVHADVVVRVRHRSDLLLHDELELFARAHHGRVIALIGSRQRVDLRRELRDHVPDLAERDVFVCGPGDFAELVTAIARRAGTPAERIHVESFAS
ncbi:MAG: putative ferric reductase [Mycobacterium sp.]|nr:putative ferric reductase [Mycobacterium sp.]